MASLKKYEKKIQSLQQASRNARKKAGEVGESVIASVETAGTATLFGLIRGRYGGKSLDIGGVPLDLGAGVGLHLLAIAGVGRNMEDHFRQVGDGCLSAAGFMWGLKTGMRADKSKVTPESAIKGQRLSDEELAQLATQ